MSVKERLDEGIAVCRKVDAAYTPQLRLTDAEALSQLIETAERWANDEADHEEPFDREGAFWDALHAVTGEPAQEQGANATTAD